jgi:methylmalonyl-CoA mutase N-terminal domain/subunit
VPPGRTSSIRTGPPARSNHGVPPLQPASIAGCGSGQALGFDLKLLRLDGQAPFYCEDCGYATHMPFQLRLRLSVDSIAFAAREMPKFHAFLEDTYYISDGGLDAVEEMALGFVEIRYVARALLARGLAIDDFAPRIAILVNCRMDFFEEIAKIRATRRLFARMMKEEFGARDPRSLAVNIASHTSGLSMTAQQPVNNIMRGATQALALALAGVQIEISAFDEPTARRARSRTSSPRTQQIIGLESNVTRVTDPPGVPGTEALTDDRAADRIAARIESMGDPARCATTATSARSSCGWSATARGPLRRTSGGGVNHFPMPAGEDTLLREMTERKIEPWRDWIETIRRGRRGDLGAARRAAAACDAAADLRAEPWARSRFWRRTPRRAIAAAMRQAAVF